MKWGGFKQFLVRRLGAGVFVTRDGKWYKQNDERFYVRQPESMNLKNEIHTNEYLGVMEVVVRGKEMTTEELESELKKRELLSVSRIKKSQRGCTLQVVLMNKVVLIDFDFFRGVFSIRKGIPMDKDIIRITDDNIGCLLDILSASLKLNTDKYEN